MEASTSAARMPLLVVTVAELLDYVGERQSESQDQHGGYGEAFTWRKTDISSSVDSPVSASRAVLGGDVRAIGGWVVAETTGTAAAAFRLHDGNAAGGEQFGRINLAAGESTRDFVPGRGIRCFTGRVFIEVISGSFEGVIIWR